MQAIRTIEGKVAPLDRADVDTDQIIPKQFLKRIERTGFGEFLFYDWVRDGEITLGKGEVLVAGRNFGCGSSREHAVWAIQQAGYKAVVAPSFADIFYNNATKNGLLPISLPEEDVRVLMNAEGCHIDLQAQLVSFGGRVVHFDIDPDIKHRLLNGLDDIAITLASEAAIDAYEQTRAGPSPETLKLR
ncbi:MAG TPA: 3-isopropylmalate dehydratase small subunit [Actinomycetota bacterium]|jgi:3-isopropylmalate/(R)-2-methylmalate dehydratase small subunit|nr:3-isopropylmalate dehydratase small subunit [Actinomycetota bacterium]